MKIWSKFKQPFLQFFSKIRSLLSVFSYMKGEVKKHLPEWKEDVEEYQQERKKQVNSIWKKIRKKKKSWKKTFAEVDASPEKLHKMLFEDKTKIGKRFEEVLIVLIIASVLVVILDSVEGLQQRMGWLFGTLEWVFTIIFTIEYLLRIYSSPHPIRYITSFYGIIDLITIIPTYISAFFVNAHTFLVLRILRVFRVFRLLKLVKMMQEGTTIMAALKASRDKIFVFLIFVLLLVTILGSVLYIVESDESGFTSIPVSIYWAIVTLTTVGYGDIAPATWFGRMIAAGIMLIGYAVIAVPTGIVSAEFVNETKKEKKRKIACSRCGNQEHKKEARYCNRCGKKLKVNKLKKVAVK